MDTFTLNLSLVVGAELISSRYSGVLLQVVCCSITLLLTPLADGRGSTIYLLFFFLTEKSQQIQVNHFSLEGSSKKTGTLLLN